MTTEIKSEQTPLEQAEAYFTECVIIANETEDIQDRKRKFEKAKQTTVGFLNFQIDYLNPDAESLYVPAVTSQIGSGG